MHATWYAYHEADCEATRTRRVGYTGGRVDVGRGEARNIRNVNASYVCARSGSSFQPQGRGLFMVEVLSEVTISSNFQVRSRVRVSEGLGSLKP